MFAYARSEGWEKKYATSTPEEMLKDKKVADDAVYEATKDEFDRRFARGEYEVVSTNGVYSSGPSYNTCEIYQIRGGDGSQVIKKSTLPETGFEEAYKLRALGTWLYEQANEREALAARR